MMITPVLTPIARWCFLQANLASLGSLSPFTKSFELSCEACDAYEQAVIDLEGIWMKMVPQFSIDVLEGTHFVEVTRPMASTQEREILARHEPDYANLRALACGDTKPRTILDDDALWVGFGSVSKSAHRYDEADRGRDYRLVNEET